MEETLRERMSNAAIMHAILRITLQSRLHSCSRMHAGMGGLCLHGGGRVVFCMGVRICKGVQRLRSPASPKGFVFARGGSKLANRAHDSGESTIRNAYVSQVCRCRSR